MNGNGKSSRNNVTNNNNLSHSEEGSTSSGSNEGEDDENFVERYLSIGNMSFSIIPNGGTGDCLFKAISQAIFEGDESEHFPIREQVVAFIAEKTWDKYQVSVQVQHINGHNNLQKSWDENPIGAYKNYMLNAGTLGSFLELNAAGELYQFNFASIQEYNDSAGITYRVENSKQFPKRRVPMHYFLFTGDFDNGHWEYLKTFNRRMELADGTYNGSLDIVIEGQISSVEFWLMENTQIGHTEFDDVPQSTFLRKRSKYPFECPLLKFESDKTVELIDVSFVITPSKYSDLFSVLANSHLRNESLSKEMHDLLTTYRNSNFSSLNYKLITQPHSHGFTTEVLKYASKSYKGNIQDLLSAADLYGFSFTIYLILTNVMHLCKFVHVDRWGGEVSTMEYFFINMHPTMLNNISKTCAHWYHLVPVKALSYTPPEKHDNSTISLKPQKSVREINCEELAAAINLENKKYIKNKAKDLYNLYFDRQINPTSDDGGDASIKPSPLESENNRFKESKQNFTKKIQETNIIEGNSNLIEMKPNVFYKYGCIEPTSSLNQNKSSNIGENSSKIENNKSHHSMQKVSSQDLRMTPSNLLYSRSSFTFNGADRKTNYSQNNESRETVMQRPSTVAITSRYIAESKTYSKIILEHKTNSANVSSAPSEKSIISDNPNDNVSILDDLHRKSSVEDVQKINELILMGDIPKSSKSKIPSSDNSENFTQKDSRRPSRKGSYTISKKESETARTMDCTRTIGKEPHLSMRKNLDEISGQDGSKKVVSKASSNISEQDLKNIQSLDYIIGKKSEDTLKINSEDICRKNSQDINERSSKLDICRKQSENICRRNSGKIHEINSKDIGEKESNDIGTIGSKDTNTRRCLKNKREESNSDIARDSTTTISESHYLSDVNRKDSDDSSENKALDINGKYLLDLCKIDSTDPCIKTRSDLLRVDLEAIRNEYRRCTGRNCVIRGGGKACRRNSRDSSEEDSVSVIPNDFNVVNNNDSEKVKRKMRIKAKRRNPGKNINTSNVTLEKEDNIQNPGSEIISYYYIKDLVESLPAEHSDKSERKVFKLLRRQSPTSITGSNISTNANSENGNVSPRISPKSSQHTVRDQSSFDNDSNCNAIPKERCRSDESCDIKDSETEVCRRYYRRQLLMLRKSEGDLISKPKSTEKRTSRSLSERVITLAKNSLSKFTSKKHSKVKPVTYSFCEKKKNRSDHCRTLGKQGYQNYSMPVNTNAAFDLISVEHEETKPFIRNAIQQRMRRESLSDGSLQTCRSSGSSSSSDSQHNHHHHHHHRNTRMHVINGGLRQQESGGCFRKICDAIGSICGKKK